MARVGQNNKGITLVALVVTIIVLLILAGVTISLVLGQTGIFSKAQDAKLKTAEAQAVEKVKLAVLELRTNHMGETVDITLEQIADKVEGGKVETPGATPDIPGIIVVDDIRVKVDENYQVSIEGKVDEGGNETPEPPVPDDGIELPGTSETTPYAPKDTAIVEGTNLDTGLVMKDKNNNEWVWVEVPKSITANSTTDAEIETALQNDASFIRRDGGVIDTWHEGCGLSETEYNSNKSKMLQSIKKYGGFWIGRYEVGTDTNRTYITHALTTPAIQQNKYPYYNIRLDQAQELATQLSPDSSYTSSLLYGIQWDLTCRYIEKKGTLEDGTKMKLSDITVDSGKWGNYKDVKFYFNRGIFSTDGTQTYQGTNYGTTKWPLSNNGGWILSTGATDRNKALNIYDLAGNEWEWTLEKNTKDNYPCIVRGGGNSSYGSDSVAYRRNVATTDWSNLYGFRPALYK